MELTHALRFEVLNAMDVAQERASRGWPNLHATLHYLKLTPRAWAEVDRALDEVRFEVRPELLEEVAVSAGEQSAEGQRLRDTLAAAKQNAAMHWSSCKQNPEGLSRTQCVALLFIAREFLKRLPAVSAGPLLPSLPLERSKA